ncbi:MAG: ERCC4 domain-containing protein [Desulfurococcaceae archaeon]
MSIRLLTPVDIIIDSREDSKNPVFKEFFKASGLKISIQPLPAGDFLLLTNPDSGKKPVLIERKTIYDFANSIRDNRLWDQARLLVEASIKDNYQPFIVIEGYIGRLVKERNWSIQSLLRAIDTLMLDFNIPVLNTTGKKSTIAWIIAKAKSLGRTEDKRLLRLRVEKKPLTINDKILYVAESFAGPVSARRLLKHFKTIRNIANASIRELMLVEGIGEKRATEIYQIFNTEWREVEEDVK